MAFEVSKGNVFFLSASDPSFCPSVQFKGKNTNCLKESQLIQKKENSTELSEKYNGRARVWLRMQSLSQTLGSTRSTKQSKTEEQQKTGVECMTRLSLENRHFFSTKNNEISLFPTAPDCRLTVHDKLSSEILK